MKPHTVFRKNAPGFYALRLEALWELIRINQTSPFFESQYGF